MSQRYILSLDFGGAELKHCLFDLATGRIVYVHPNPHGPFYRPNAAENKCVLDTVLLDVPPRKRVSAHLAKETERVLAKAREELGPLDPSDIAGVGISVAGKVFNDGSNGEPGKFIGANTPPEFAVTDKFGQQYVETTGGLMALFPGVPVVIGNDCNCTGNAQSWVYEQRGVDPLTTFFITIGQGFGGGGPKMDVDEVGHIKVYGLPPALRVQCGCGEWDCIESIASGNGMPRFARKVMGFVAQEPKEAVDDLTHYERLAGRLDKAEDLADLVQDSPLRDVSDLRAEHIFEHANLEAPEGDGFARYLVRLWDDATGYVVASIANTHGLTVFGLGGSVARNNPKYVEQIAKAANGVIGQASKFSPHGIRVELSPLGAVANDYGPASLVLPRKHRAAWVAAMLDVPEKQP